MHAIDFSSRIQPLLMVIEGKLTQQSIFQLLANKIVQVSGLHNTAFSVGHCKVLILCNTMLYEALVIDFANTYTV